MNFHKNPMQYLLLYYLHFPDEVLDKEKFSNLLYLQLIGAELFSPRNLALEIILFPTLPFCFSKFVCTCSFLLMTVLFCPKCFICNIIDQGAGVYKANYYSGTLQ